MSIRAPKNKQRRSKKLKKETFKMDELVKNVLNMAPKKYKNCTKNGS